MKIWFTYSLNENRNNNRVSVLCCSLIALLARKRNTAKKINHNLPHFSLQRKQKTLSIYRLFKMTQPLLDCFVRGGDSGGSIRKKSQEILHLFFIVSMRELTFHGKKKKYMCWAYVDWMNECVLRICLTKTLNDDFHSSPMILFFFCKKKWFDS